MSDPREAAQRRNEDARARADADPAAVADHATGANLPNLTARLAEWPVPGVDPGEMATARRDMVIRGEAGHDLDPDETAAADQWSTLTPFEQVERRVVAQRQHDHAEANQTAAWRAMMARDLAAQWVQREALAAVLNMPPPPMLAAAAVPARLVEHLANLPERRGSDTGLSLLTVLVEALPSPRDAFKPVARASLPRLAKLGHDAATLPDFPLQDAPAAPGEQLDLPGFGDAVRGCASWLLWLFDQAGGESLASGRGARWELRLFVYALLHLDVADRDGQWHTLRIAASPEHAKAIEDATGRPMANVEDWLHPHGWSNKRRDWHNLPEALRRMSRELSYVPVDGIGYVAMLFPSVIPAKQGDPLVEFTARVPRVAAHGDRLSWPRLLEYGADSARLFRAYLAVVAWLGRSAKRGHPMTRQIAAPVLGPDGEPARRRKGGAIVRSATERIDNPAARYVGPPLSEADLARMIGFDPTDRRRRGDARAAFERMEADGVIEIERDGRGWLLFGGPHY